MKESKTLSVLNLGENLLTDKIMSALAQSLVRLLYFLVASLPIQLGFGFLDIFTSGLLCLFCEICSDEIDRWFHFHCRTILSLIRPHPF